MSIHGHAALRLHALQALDALERRKSPTARTLKTGRVILRNALTADCVIRDLSRGGARLVFGAPLELDETFELLVVTTHSFIPAALVWQRGLAAGVVFTGPQRPQRAALNS